MPPVHTLSFGSITKLSFLQNEKTAEISSTAERRFIKINFALVDSFANSSEVLQGAFV